MRDVAWFASAGVLIGAAVLVAVLVWLPRPAQRVITLEEMCANSGGTVALRCLCPDDDTGAMRWQYCEASEHCRARAVEVEPVCDLPSDWRR